VRLLAEDLVLVLLDENGRVGISGRRLDLALTGAMLADLVQLRRVGLTGADGVSAPGTRPGRVVIIDPTDTGDELLDSALILIADRRAPMRPAALLPRVDPGFRQAVLDRLVREGKLTHERRKVLRVFNANRWFVADRTRAVEVDTRLSAALVVGLTPNAHTAALIGLLQAVGQTKRVATRADRNTANDRAREFMAASWVAKAVHRAIMNAESSD
jgi:hypothetical protein